MTAVTAAEVIPYTPQQMFDLVNDVEDYPRFLPWCRDARIDERSSGSIVATLTIAKGPLHHAFTTRNVLTVPSRIDMQLVAGPFRRFQGVWRFEEAAGGCRVSLDLEFEFSNRVLSSALGKVFKGLTASMVGAFRERARQRYG